MTAIIVCGVQKGLEKEYRCPYCGDESDDIDDFATSMCWDCMSENMDLEEENEDSKCVERA